MVAWQRRQQPRSNKTERKRTTSDTSTRHAMGLRPPLVTVAALANALPGRLAVCETLFALFRSRNGIERERNDCRDGQPSDEEREIAHLVVLTVFFTKPSPQPCA